jgi:hypothetical protein
MTRDQLAAALEEMAEEVFHQAAALLRSDAARLREMEAALRGWQKFAESPNLAKYHYVESGDMHQDISVLADEARAALSTPAEGR